MEVYILSIDNRIFNYEEIPLILKVNDICNLLGIGKKKSYALLKELFNHRKYPSKKMGVTYFISKNNIIKWLENQ